jgi:cytochrome c biogenesis protein CcdA
LAPLLQQLNCLVLGAPYLAIITILRIDFNATALMLMVLYNLLFVAPLIVILIMVAGGTKVSAVSSWKEEKKGAMRLMVGCAPCCSRLDININRKWYYQFCV